MPAKPHTFPQIKVMMVSFDMMPRQDEGLVQMVRYDLSRMKSSARQKRALGDCNAYRVLRSEEAVTIDFFDMSTPEDKRTRFRMVYELIPPFA